MGVDTRQGVRPRGAGQAVRSGAAAPESDSHEPQPETGRLDRQGQLHQTLAAFNSLHDDCLGPQVSGPHI